jgi:hypothetical protein
MYVVNKVTVRAMWVHVMRERVAGTVWGLVLGARALGLPKTFLLHPFG